MENHAFTPPAWVHNLPLFSINGKELLEDDSQFIEGVRNLGQPALESFLGGFRSVADLVLDYCGVHEYDCLLEMVGDLAGSIRENWSRAVEERLDAMLSSCEEMTLLAPIQAELDNCGQAALSQLQDVDWRDCAYSDGRTMRDNWCGPYGGNCLPVISKLASASLRWKLTTRYWEATRL